MSGLCHPNAAYKLIKALRKEIAIPVHFHTHDSSGIAGASIIKAAEAGVDAVDLLDLIALWTNCTAELKFNYTRYARRQARYQARPKILR